MSTKLYPTGGSQFWGHRTHPAGVDVHEHSSFLPDGALHRSPHEQVWEAICVEVHRTDRSAKIRAKLLQSKPDPVVETRAGSFPKALSDNKCRDILPFYLSFHIRYLVLLHQCWICMPAIGKRFRKGSTATPLKKSLFDQNINFPDLQLLEYIF